MWHMAHSVANSEQKGFPPRTNEKADKSRTQFFLLRRPKKNEKKVRPFFS